MYLADPRSSRCLVIGSGLAGLQFALLAAGDGHDVCVVTKKDSQESNSNYAQGGIAAVLSPLDHFDLHVRDTLAAGDGLGREDVVRRMVEAGPRLIQRLLAAGARFQPAEAAADVPFDLGREGGHSCRRILHAKDLTGHMLETTLLERCGEHAAITIDEDHLAVDLILGGELGLTGDAARRVVGCWTLDRRTQSHRAFLADIVVLATGGCGKVYRYTSNPDIATGDGLAMAYRAGAPLANLEFVQFHPTCLYHPEAKSFLISEAVRGEGAHLVNRRGERFMPRYDPAAELAPRDVVARGIDSEMKLSGDPCVYLDLRHLPRARVEARFPHLVATCRRYGLDLAGEPVPVVPAAHYMCGGVVVDADGRSALPGLFVVGESACTGIHGANRLASNSLLEAIYLAEAAAQAARSEPRIITNGARWHLPPDPLQRAGGAPGAVILEHDWDSVRRVMWDYVGIVRDRERLDVALSRLRGIRRTVEVEYATALVTPELVELRNIALLGELIVLCARARRESRGLHYTTDYPAKAPGAARDTLIGRNQPTDGETAWEPETAPGDAA
ncbi:MAG: L-aspartate oxidase [Candidatus Krumholzibacteria bacterium]|jgi:L-aspartate oxidase|nr:L-aspartate oxidase [Candidatus Krumholzibacteria bacterium]